MNPSTAQDDVRVLPAEEAFPAPGCCRSILIRVYVTPNAVVRSCFRGKESRVHVASARQPLLYDSPGMVSTGAAFSVHQTSTPGRKEPCIFDDYRKVTISLARPEFG